MLRLHAATVAAAQAELDSSDDRHTPSRVARPSSEHLRRLTQLTVFACPKPLDGGHIETIQRNAVGSWALLPGPREVILFGDGSTARLAGDLGVAYGGTVESTASGAPLLDRLFEAAEAQASGRVLAYVNSDIILMSDFANAVERVVAARRPFLMVGQRTELDVLEPIEFVAGWDARLRERARREGKLQSHQAIDYFVFPAGLWGQVPALAVGRAAFDNWLLYQAREVGAALVDATAVVTAVHQRHDYGHVGGGATEVWTGPDAERNRALAGGYENLLYIHDATHMLTRWGLAPALAPRYLRQRRVRSGLSAWTKAALTLRRRLRLP